MAVRKLAKDVVNLLIRRPKKQTYLEKLVAETSSDGDKPGIDEKRTIANSYHEAQYTTPIIEPSRTKPKVYPLEGNKKAAVLVAIELYMEAEREERKKSEDKLNRWRLSGFQDSMNIRQLWQQRVGAVAGGPVGQSAYPLLKFHHH